MCAVMRLGTVCASAASVASTRCGALRFGFGVRSCVGSERVYVSARLRWHSEKTWREYCAAALSSFPVDDVRRRCWCLKQRVDGCAVNSVRVRNAPLDNLSSVRIWFGFGFGFVDGMSSTATARSDRCSLLVSSTECVCSPSHHTRLSVLCQRDAVEPSDMVLVRAVRSSSRKYITDNHRPAYGFLRLTICVL